MDAQTQTAYYVLYPFVYWRSDGYLFGYALDPAINGNSRG